MRWTRQSTHYHTQVSMSALYLTLALFATLPKGIVQAEAFTLTTLHTNDVHARFEQTNAYSGECSEANAEENKCFGGVARRATVVKEIRRRHDNVLLLDAGDQFQGTVWFSHYEGEATAYFMNQLGYDAMCLGNHEFDNGVSGLVTPFLSNVIFPVLGANIYSTDAKLKSHIKPHVTLNVSGELIGVIGYTTTETKKLTDPVKTQGVEFGDEVANIRTSVNLLLASGVNKIIALGHTGFPKSTRVAEIEGVDIVIDGHSNTFLYNGSAPSNEVPVATYPFVVERPSGTKALVLQAYAYGKYLGYLQTTFDEAGEVVSWTGNPVLLNASYEEDADMLAEITTWREPLEVFSLEIVGSSLVHLDGARLSCRARECNLGNLIADAVVTANTRGPNDVGWSNVSMAVWNGGGIRVPVEPGPISRATVLQVLPFRNNVDLVYIRGSVFLEMLEHSVARIDGVDGPKGQFLQMSGVRVVYNLDRPVGERVVGVTVRCTTCRVPQQEPLELDRVYAVLMPDFLKNGGDGYSMIAEKMVYNEYIGTEISSLVADYLAKFSPVFPELQGRISFVNDADRTTPPPPVTCRAGRERHNALHNYLGLCVVAALATIMMSS